MQPPKYCDAATAAELIRQLGHEFAVVRNPAYVATPYEVYPLAPRPALPLPGLSAIVCDMDGTITSTEPLCLHALEHMVRRITNRLDSTAWAGLDRAADYPHVIGNSTTRHIEYLLEKYGAAMEAPAFHAALLDSALWTILRGRDATRREEAIDALAHAGLAAAIETARAENWSRAEDPVEALRERCVRWLRENAGAGQVSSGDDPARLAVRGGIEIYYARYHQILSEIEAGRARELGLELLHGDDARLIRPMPGVELFLALARGLLSDEEIRQIVAWSAPRLAWQGHAAEHAPDYTAAAALQRLCAVAARWRRQPLKMAVVTSSIRHEAEIVLAELFRQIRLTFQAWPLEPERQAALAREFAGPEVYYNTIVTASDSSEIRLKPHRDLYALALHRLGIAREDFNTVLGLEDSESGLIAIRAAGIGQAVAVPFDDTLGHDLSAAAKINYRGLWELMLEDFWFVAA